ncbi:MAG: MBL fold metallo-hydrolase [Verrucomicrobia bacterium]|nr:MAG: MBL fold metallo-hydrolase [Verrucomicrobiota bacterium]
MPDARFTLLNRTTEIGANSYLLEIGDTRIVLDAGMHPKEKGQASIPRYEDLPHDSLDAIIVTHSHLDHVGTLPVLMRDQPSARVFMTPATCALADALLHNSVNVMKSQRAELGIEDYPLFTHRSIDKLIPRIEPRDYEKPFDLDWNGSVKATFYDAGHILGSAGVLLEGNSKRFFYSGDIRFEDHALIKGARFPDLAAKNLDAMIVETTRGDSPRPASYCPKKERNRFINDIEQCLNEGGSVLVPVFAIGKTQEVLTMIHEAKLDHSLRDAPVYIGGLSTKMTVVYDKFSGSTRRSAPDFKILRDMNPITGNRRGRRPIPLERGAIYALSSGMMTEKTTSNGFARGFIDKPGNMLLFVGYADPDSPGGKIRAAQAGDEIQLDPELPGVPLNCGVKVYDFSGHAPRNHLLDFMQTANAQKTVLVHGDPSALEWFEKQVEGAVVPSSGRPLSL